MKPEFFSHASMDRFTRAFYRPVAASVTTEYPIQSCLPIEFRKSEWEVGHAVAYLNIYLGISNSSAAVDSLINFKEELRGIVMDGNSSTLKSFLKPSYEETALTISITPLTEELHSIVTMIDDLAQRLFNNSELLNCIGDISKVKLVVGCDPVVSQYLIRAKDSFDVFQKFTGEKIKFPTWDIVSTVNVRIRGNVFITFAPLESPEIDAGPTGSEFGFMFFKTDHLTEESISVGDSWVIQPKRTFINTMPILGVINVTLRNTNET